MLRGAGLEIIGDAAVSGSLFGQAASEECDEEIEHKIIAIHHTRVESVGGEHHSEETDSGLVNGSLGVKED